MTVLFPAAGRSCAAAREAAVNGKFSITLLAEKASIFITDNPAFFFVLPDRMANEDRYPTVCRAAFIVGDNVRFDLHFLDDSDR